MANAINDVMLRINDVTPCGVNDVGYRPTVLRFTQTYVIIHHGDYMSLLEYLQNNISTNNSLDEIINVFEEMCKTLIEEDLLL